MREMNLKRQAQVWALATGLVTFGALATSSHAGITGSAHDFATYSWSGGQTCLPCHTPHGEPPAFQAPAVEGGLPTPITYAPLWNHETTAATYRVYESDGSTTTVNVDRRSRMCLSCHDGTVALENFSGNTGGDHFIDPDAKIGVEGDLTENHPIGDAAIYTTSTTTTSMVVQDSSHKVNGLRLRVMPNGTDYVVGCTTCHSTHNSTGLPHMLQKAVVGSGTTGDGRTVNGSLLCFSCHKK